MRKILIMVLCCTLAFWGCQKGKLISPPTGLMIESLASGYRVSWQEVPGADGYNIFRSDTENGDFKKLNASPVSGSRFDDTTMGANSVCWYKVAVVKGGLDQEKSSAGKAGFISIQSVKADPVKADELNTKGMGLYKAGKYKEAGELFREAIKMNPDHKYANYNLVCMLTLQLTGSDEELLRRVNDENGPLNEIKNTLIRAIVIDPGAALNAKADNDLKRLRDLGLLDKWIMENFGYTDGAIVRAKLTDVVYWKNKNVKYEYNDFISFKKDGTFKLVIITDINPNGFPPHETSEGRFSVKPTGEFTFTYTDGSITVPMRIGNDGETDFIHIEDLYLIPENNPGIEQQNVLGLLK